MQKINSTNIIPIVVTPAIAMGLASYDALKDYYESDDKSKLNSVIQDTVTITTIAGGLYLSNKGLAHFKTSDVYKKLNVPEFVKNYMQGIAVSLSGVIPGVLIKDFLDKRLHVKKKNTEEKDQVVEYFDYIDKGIGNIKKAYGYSGISITGLDVPMGAVDTTEMINGEKKTGLDKIKTFAKSIIIGPIIPTLAGVGFVAPFTKYLKEKEPNFNKFILVFGSIYVGLGAELLLNKIVEKLTPSDKTREKILKEITSRQKELIKLDFINNSLSNLKQFEIDSMMKTLNELKAQTDKKFSENSK